jgi:hypothetical protein
LEQGISQSKTGNGWEIYSDFEVRFESSLEASHVLQPKAVHEIFETLECGVIV